MTPRNQLSSELIRIRFKKKLTESEVAARCGIHLTQYEEIERGECALTLGLLYRLSTGLQVDPLKLIGIDLNHAPEFTCFENLLVTDEMEAVRTYGIAVSSREEQISIEDDAMQLQYADLTTEKEKLLCLIDLMNKYQLAAVHVEDVIEDFLVDFTVN